jgi:hypothetical protein
MAGVRTPQEPTTGTQTTEAGDNMHIAYIILIHDSEGCISFTGQGHTVPSHRWVAHADQPRPCAYGSRDYRAVQIASRGPGIEDIA